MRQIFTILALLVSPVTLAQDAVLEEQGAFGECLRYYMAKNSFLVLYEKPDLNSISKTIPYGKNWDIPLVEGITRVISTGKVIAKMDYFAGSCEPTIQSTITAGKEIEVLYGLGEGWGVILFQGSHCQAPIWERTDIFEHVSYPEIHVWFKVKFKDGSSPGWLFHDGSQTKVWKTTC